MKTQTGENQLLARPAQEVAANVPLDEEAKALLQDGITSRQYLDRLIEKHQYPAAIQFLAHALAKREAVWWACQCARQVAGPNPPAKIATALQAAEKWVADPSEDCRRAALPAAEAAEFTTPAGSAAVAAFWSGGSLGPANVPAIPPGEQLTARGVAGAILLAGVQAEPQKAPDKYRQFLASGIALADGAAKWNGEA